MKGLLAFSVAKQCLFSEQIFGYRDLKVGIFYTADSLSTYIDISYTSKVDPQLSKGVMVSLFLAVINSFLSFIL